jgi:ABC-2 type transport system ATP-binding protein
MLTGLVRPSSGRARLLGRPLGDREAKRQIGYLPEMFRFHDWLTANEFLDVHGRLAGMPADARRSRIPEALELVGLSGRGDHQLRTFSKGMQQRAGLAQAILHHPKLIFLDEPTSALDPIGRRIVRDIIRELAAGGATIFLNSHLLTEVELVCDRVAILNRGTLVAAGRLDELRPRGISVNLRIGGWSERIESLARELGTVEALEEAGHGVVLLHLLLPSEDLVAHLVSEFVAAGAEIYEVIPRRETLEDLFVNLVDQTDGMDIGA